MVDVCRILKESALRFISFYDGVMMVIVLLNSAVDVSLTFPSVSITAGWHLMVLEMVFLAFYIVECLFKIITLRCKFFLSVLNILDLLITLVGVVDLLVDVIDPRTTESSHFASFFRILKMVKGLRAVKVFRILRVLGYSKDAQRTWRVLQRSTKSIMVILSLMLGNFLMFSVIFRETFSDSDPQRFGSLVKTMASLMQVMSLDDWLSVYYTSRDNGAGYIIIFLVLFILIQCYILLCLAGAVLLDNFTQADKEPRAGETTESQSEEQTDQTMSDEEFDEETCKDDTFEQNKHRAQFSLCYRRKALMEKYWRLREAIAKKEEEFKKQIRVLSMFTKVIIDDPPGPYVASGDLRGHNEA
nr:cation channel sperm-associated protein 1-like isoform X2 [Misgurnus anguillicaudatus]XP_055033045.1 cation channel sperm-associated protein 1-like isoform X2 [Misgurnus anguillicaudatus]XP_055033053.1 cation channel sperm-associated protein 1-like isoform X2 [Misgurnus anguillicaudatus]